MDRNKKCLTVYKATQEIEWIRRNVISVLDYTSGYFWISTWACLVRVRNNLLCMIQCYMYIAVKVEPELGVWLELNWGFLLLSVSLSGGGVAWRGSVFGPWSHKQSLCVCLCRGHMCVCVFFFFSTKCWNVTC